MCKCIIPFYRLPKTENNVIPFMLFLSEGGTKFWKTDEENPSLTLIQNEYLEPNGFIGTLTEKNNFVFCELNKLNLEDYYNWTETNTDECWRSFFYIDEEGWKKELEEIKIENFSIHKILSFIL